MKKTIIILLMTLIALTGYTNVSDASGDLNSKLLYECEKTPADIELIKSLLAGGADINTTNVGGYTPVMRASEKNNLDAIKLLVSHGADINKSNKAGFTALMRAIVRGHHDIVYFLVENGADTGAVTVKGFSVRDIAKNYNRTEIINYLEQIKRSKKTKGFKGK